MATVLTMPLLGLTMKEGTVATWLKKEGDQVERGEVIAELLSDKSTVDYESRQTGILLKIVVPEGQSTAIGNPLCIVGEAGEDIAELLKEGSGTTPVPAPSSPASPLQAKPAMVAETATVAVPLPSSPGRKFASPAARKCARDKGIDLSVVTGTGPGGRIVEKDILHAAATHYPATPVALKAAEQLGVALPETDGRIRLADVEGMVPQTSVPMNDIQKAIARRMTESKQTIPHFYLTADIDCGNLKTLRSKLAGAVEKRYRSRLTYNDLIVKATALALERHPGVNASFGGDHIIINNNVNIGLAVGIKDGLLVPVVRDAARKSLGQISAELAELVRKARMKRLMPDEYGCGTFTISNLGMYGISSFQAIVNPPESVIMALGSMRDCPAVIDGQLVARTMMTVTLSLY